MLTRSLLCIFLGGQLASCSHLRALPGKTPPDSSPAAWSGTYHYNATDSDFDSHLNIRFYPNRGSSFSIVEWWADGSIKNNIIHQKITFKRAMAAMTQDGPTVHCIHLDITPGHNDSGKKVFWIDGREHATLD